MLDLICCFDLLEKKGTNDILRFTISSTCRWCLGCAGSQMPQQRNLCRTGWSHHQSSLCPWPINIDNPGPCLIAFVAFPRQIKGLQLNVAGQIMSLRKSWIARQVLSSPENGPELAPKAGLHEHVEELAILERLEKLHNELAVRLLHDFLLWEQRMINRGFKHRDDFHWPSNRSVNLFILQKSWIEDPMC